MSKILKLTYCGMEGEGATVTAAKKDAAAKIERVLTADYSPRLVAWGSVAYLIWREPTTDGRVSIRSQRIINDDGSMTRRPAGGCYHSAADTIDDVESQIMLHVAQQTWTGSDNHPLLSGREDLQREFKSWATWQNRYKHARECGMNDNEAHHFAGNALYLLRGRDGLTKIAQAELEREAVA